MKIDRRRFIVFSSDAIVATAVLPGFEGYQSAGTLTLAGVLGVAYDELTAK